MDSARECESKDKKQSDSNDTILIAGHGLARRRAAGYETSRAGQNGVCKDAPTEQAQQAGPHIALGLTNCLSKLLIKHAFVEIRFACLHVYLRTHGYGTPVSIPVHTPYINAYVF